MYYNSHLLWFVWILLQLMVMTPAILKDALAHSYLSLSTIKLLIFDECHNARGKHDYVQIMTVCNVSTPF